MEAEISQRIGTRPHPEVRELVLVKWKSKQLSQQDQSFLQTFSELQSLSLVNAGLHSVARFPCLQHLKVLQIPDSKLKAGFNLLSVCPNIIKLNLAGNLVSELESVQQLEVLPKLESLDLLGNPVTEKENYRQKVFQTLKNLVVLDGKNQENQEDSVFSDSVQSEEDEEGDLSDFIDDEQEKAVKRKSQEDKEPEKSIKTNGSIQYGQV